MNTLFSFAIVATLLGCTLADTCTIKSLAAASDAVSPTVEGTVTGAGDLSSLAISVLFVAVDGATGDDVTVALTGQDLSAGAFTDGTGVALTITDTLTAGKTYNLQITYTGSEGDMVYCEQACGVTSTSTTVGACEADTCSDLVVSMGAGSKIKAAIKGKLTTASPAAGDTVTLAFEAKDGGEDVADDPVTGIVLPNDFSTTAEDVQSAATIAADKIYEITATFPGSGYPAAADVECPKKCFSISTDETTADEVDCPADDGDAAAAMSASVFVLVAAFVARAF